LFVQVAAVAAEIIIHQINLEQHILVEVEAVTAVQSQVQVQEVQQLQQGRPIQAAAVAEVPAYHQIVNQLELQAQVVQVL
jgi:hypothetical protein